MQSSQSRHQISCRRCRGRYSCWWLQWRIRGLSDRWEELRGEEVRLLLGGFRGKKVGATLGQRENLGVLRVVVGGQREALCKCRKGM